MSIPTRGEVFSKLIEHLRLAQEASAMMAHLDNAEGKTQTGRMWLHFSELQAEIVNKSIELAKRGIQ